MEIVLAAVGIAVAGFCVWLTVRIVNRGERWAKWTAVALVAMLVGYPLSFAPAVHLYAYGILPMDVAVVIYRPIRGMLHQAMMSGKRRKYVTLGNDRVNIAMGEIIAYLYGPATVKK